MRQKYFKAGIALYMFSGIASAQSSVTMYGILSNGLAYVNNEAGSSNIKLLSGANQNNRLGFKIVEDLGGGSSAIAMLENGFDSNTGKLGQGGRLFGRQAWVGIRNSELGTVTLGRQYDMFWDYLTAFSPATATNGLAATPGDADNLMGSWRYSNSVKYASPSWNGLSAEVLYAFSNAAGQFPVNRAFSAGVGYSNGPVQVGAAYVELDRPGVTNPNGAVSDDYAGAPFWLFRTSPLNSAVGVEKQRNVGVGGRYDFSDRVRVNLLADNVHYFYRDGTGFSLSNAQISASYNLSPSLMFGAAYIYSIGRYAGVEGNSHWNTAQLSVDYALSKRTDLFLYDDWQRASGPRALAVIYLNSPSSSKVQNLLVAGIRHRF